MFVVRYVALVALAIWVGGMVAPFWPGAAGPPAAELSRRLAYPCGAAVLVSLFVLKFVGPPPRAFPLRAALVVLMLTIVSSTRALQLSSLAPTAVAIALGLVLLSWYAYE